MFLDKLFIKNEKTISRESKDVILTQNHVIKNDGVNNQNTLVVGSVGVGKTFGFVKANLLNKGCSFVVADVKGQLINEFGAFFIDDEQQGLPSYKVKKVDFVDLGSSLHYNPFFYIHNEDDILAFANAIKENTSTGEKRITNDSFWDEMAYFLITSLICYVIEALPKEKWNMNSVLDIYNDKFRRDQGDENSQCPYEIMLEELSYRKPNNMASKYFAKIAYGVANTYSSILAEAGSMLAPFENENVREFLRYDELNIERIGDERTALFIIINETNPSFNFLVGILFTQIFNTLLRKADGEIEGKLEEHVRFILDDFANYKIPNIENVIASARSRNISMEFIIQSESQLFYRYRDMAKNIIANCVYVYLGGNDIETERNIGIRLGKTTTEIQNMEGKAIVFFPEGKTIFDEKANYKEHKNYDILWKSRLKYSKPDMRKKYPEIRCAVRETVSFWDRNAQNVAMNIESHCSKDITDDIQRYSQCARVKTSWSDSEEEETFYKCMKELLKGHFYYHQSLRDIFTTEEVMIRSKSYGWKMIDMHCDFILRDADENVVLGIEIDGEQHTYDNNQYENDLFKNALFENHDIPLCRIKTRDLRDSLDLTINALLDFMREKGLEKFIIKSENDSDINVNTFLYDNLIYERKYAKFGDEK